MDTNAIDEHAFATVRMTDGRIVVGGVWESGSPPEFMVRRYLADGRPDSSLGQAGWVHLPNDQISAAGTDVAVQADNKLVLIGTDDFTNEVIVRRLHEDGTIDTAFANAGRFAIGQPFQLSFGNKIFALPGGDILFTLHLNDGNGEYLASVRLNTDGSLDPAYGANGIARVSFADPLLRIDATCLHQDGSVVIAGVTDQMVDQTVVLARLDPNGLLDPNFGNAGIVSIPQGLFEMDIWDITRDLAGRYYLAGNHEDTPLQLEIVVCRLSDAGQLDSLYGQAGELLIGNTGFEYSAQSLLIDSAGNLLVSGRIADPLDRFFVARALPDGQLDAGFGSGGAVAHDFGVALSGGMAAALQPDGRLIVAGYGVRPGIGVFTILTRLWMGTTVASGSPATMVEARCSPNPTEGDLVVQWQAQAAGDWAWSLTDLQGRTVLSSADSLNLPSGMKTLHLDLSRLDAGMYLLRLEGDAGAVTRRILIR